MSHSSYDHDFYAVGLTGLVTFHFKGKKSFELLFEYGFNPDPLNNDTVNICLVAILLIKCRLLKTAWNCLVFQK